MGMLVDAIVDVVFGKNARGIDVEVEAGLVVDKVKLVIDDTGPVVDDRDVELELSIGTVEVVLIIGIFDEELSVGTLEVELSIV